MTPNLKLDPPPPLTTPDLSGRRPNSGSKPPSPGKHKKDRQLNNLGSGSGSSSGLGSGRKSSNHKIPSQQSLNSTPKRNSALPSIIGLNEDKPKVPVDTIKALQGTEYRPKSPKYMVNIERSFSSC